MATVQWLVPIFSLLAWDGARVAHRLSFVRRGGSVTFKLGAINLKLVRSREWPGLASFSSRQLLLPLPASARRTSRSALNPW
jgi:hypothetical protein